MVGPATGKARPPTVDGRREGGLPCCLVMSIIHQTTSQRAWHRNVGRRCASTHFSVSGRQLAATFISHSGAFSPTFRADKLDLCLLFCTFSFHFFHPYCMTTCADLATRCSTCTSAVASCRPVFVCLSVCLSVTSRCSIETAGEIELVLACGFFRHSVHSYTAF